MCSSVERHAATIWTLSNALCDGSKEVDVVVDLRKSVNNLHQFVCHSWDTDRPMIRLAPKLRTFISDKINSDSMQKTENMSQKDVLSYCHMLAAMANDFFDQIPEKPLDRAKAWLDLCNAIARLINELDSPGSGRQAARGCLWATEIKEILRKI